MDNLLEISDEAISINETGMMIVRNIAMAFDPDLAVNTNQYSKTI
jgi:coproporphyrinogen III oxidase-like Fe-S oxidoreductase